VIDAAHLIPGAEERWSLDQLEQSIPSHTPDASTFSVFRGSGKRRTFRYAASNAASSVYDCSADQQAERTFMHFSDFAQKKRACASGQDDEYAYYLWGVVLRRSAQGSYEGFNFGQMIDQDMIERTRWDLLSQLRAAGGWGDFEQAQIFIGCRDALTPCHYDLVHNVYVQVSGWKRFLLLDPEYANCLYPYPVAHPMDRCARADLEKPDFERFPLLGCARAVEAVLGPGDALVLPAGWWHHVQSLTEDSISVSFWFQDDLTGRAAVQKSLVEGPSSVRLASGLDHVLLAREAERMLIKVVGPAEVQQALGQLRGLLGSSDAPKPNSEQLLPCTFVLWRLTRLLGPAGARQLVTAGGLLGDGRRLHRLTLNH